MNDFTTYSWAIRAVLVLKFFMIAEISVSGTNNTATHIYIKQTCSYV